MSDPKYYQGTPEDKVIEECAELILAMQKLKRFGKQAKDPFTGIEYDNLTTVKAECADVMDAMKNWHRSLNESF